MDALASIRVADCLMLRKHLFMLNMTSDNFALSLKDLWSIKWKYINK